MKIRQQSLLFIAILSLLIFSFVSFFQSKVYQQIATDQELISITFNAAIENERKHADTFFNRIINHPHIQNVMYQALTADEAQETILRNQLHSMLKGEYAYRSEHGNLKQLHFHTPDNHSFLRFHRPQKFGDDLTQVRPTIVHVNQTKQPVISFEEGRIYNGYRFVYPLFYGDVHVGSVEASVSIKALTDIFTTYLQSTTSFMLRRSIVEEKVFIDELSNYKSSGLSANYVIEKSIHNQVEALTLKLHAKGHMSHAEHESRMSQGEFFSDFSHSASSLFISHYFPIFNELTEVHSGYFIIVREHQELGALFIRLVIFLLVLIALTIAGFMIFNHLKKTQTQLATQSDLLDEIQNIAHVGTWDLDFKRNQLHCSNKVYEIFGLNPALPASVELFTQAVHPEDRKEFTGAFNKALENKQDYTLTHRVIHPNGEVRFISEHGHFILDDNQEAISLVGLTRDNSEHATLVEQLQLFINTQRDLILLINEHEIEFANQALLDFFKLEDIAALQAQCANLNRFFLNYDGFFHAENLSNAEWVNAIMRLPQRKRVVLMNDATQIRHAFSISLSPLDKDKHIVAFHDITETVSEIQKLTDRAQHDTLTKAFNRDYLETLMMQIAVNSHSQQYFMMMFDIDHFKQLNDELGHLTGDSVLKELSKLVNDSIRDNDSLIRWGGEEFVIIGEASGLEVAINVAEKLRVKIQQHKFAGVTQAVTCSFGVTTFENTETLESIIARADKLLYAAKKSQRNCVKADGLG